MTTSSDQKLAAFAQYMSQFATHRGADMKWVMDASSHGRIFSYAWDEATRLEREACAKVCEQAGVKTGEEEQETVYDTGGFELEAGFYSTAELREMIKALDEMNASVRRMMGEKNT